MEPGPRGRHAAHRRAQDHRLGNLRTGNKPTVVRSARFIATVVAGLVSALLGTALVIHAAGAHKIVVASNAITGPLFGASASSQSELTQTTGQFGHMPIVRVFYPGLPSASAWATGAAGLNRSAVIVSFKAMAQTILSGADDAVLSHFFDSAPIGHPIYYSYYPEPERYIAAGLFTVSEYKAAWTRIVALADAANNPDLQSTLILTSYDLSPQSGRDWKNYLAGGGTISTLGWDAYPAGTVEDHDPQPTPPGGFMGPEVAASRSAGLPFGFAEFALATQNGRPGWLTAVGNYLASSGALFGTYFDSAGFAGMQLTDSASISAWRSVIARSGTDVPLSVNAPGGPVPAAVGPQITALAIAPARIPSAGGRRATITFRVSQAADITVCILGGNGSVVQELARPAHLAGQVSISYDGYGENGLRNPAGRYPVLVVASNAHGSATAEATLTITAP